MVRRPEERPNSIGARFSMHDEVYTDASKKLLENSLESQAHVAPPEPTTPGAKVRIIKPPVPSYEGMVIDQDHQELMFTAADDVLQDYYKEQRMAFPDRGLVLLMGRGDQHGEVIGYDYPTMEEAIRAINYRDPNSRLIKPID